ncbi:Pycsar system effector family protein [Actinokineospora globicatena]|uniref:Integral membrane plasmid transfer protein n=1 Tax=Actinokineospora globicatena TaxID=103729 RepID=A0A9W6QRW7_9PSEU|nr:Pycsar system effector family protein [Actinokineospora globicatena]GLW95438.1 integral membrane plasmid transfer protein [Actinokineospora globicatena]
MTIPPGLELVRSDARVELERADDKGKALVKVVGIALAGVVALTGRSMSPVAMAMVWASAVPIGMSVLVLLSVIRPRLNGPVQGSWLHAATVGPETLLRTLAGEQSAVFAATHVCRLAAIARSKYRRIQVAVTLLVIGLLLLAVGLVLSAVTR